MEDGEDQQPKLIFEFHMHTIHTMAFTHMCASTLSLTHTHTRRYLKETGAVKYRKRKIKRAILWWERLNL